MKSDLKKLIVFSSEINKQVVEGIIADEASIDGRTQSALIEQHILNDMLPSDPGAFQLVALMDYPKDVRYTPANVIDGLFSDLSAGTMFDAAHDNGLPLVRYAAKMQAMLKVDEKMVNHEDYPYLISKLDTFIKGIKNKAPEVAPSDLVLLEEQLNNKDAINLTLIYNVIIDNWSYIGNWTITYRLLVAMVRVDGHRWIDAPSVRVELRRLAKEVCDQW